MNHTTHPQSCAESDVFDASINAHCHDGSPRRPVAFVTGSSQRLGEHVIEALAARGFECVVHANRSLDKANAVARRLRETGATAHVLQLNIDDPIVASERAVQGVRELTGLWPAASVLCAASYDNDDALSPDHEGFQRQLNLNFLFPVHYCVALARRLSRMVDREPCPWQPHRLLNSGDHSVTVFSDYKIERVNADFFSYSISKHALQGSLPYLAVAHARHMRINAIMPGPVLAAHGMTQDVLNRKIAHESVTGRHPDPEDIAATAVFLATTPSLVGQTICVDAGARHDARLREVCFD